MKLIVTQLVKISPAFFEPKFYLGSPQPFAAWPYLCVCVGGGVTSFLVISPSLLNDPVLMLFLHILTGLPSNFKLNGRGIAQAFSRRFPTVAARALAQVR
jgi:hypothetical protein